LQGILLTFKTRGWCSRQWTPKDKNRVSSPSTHLGKLDKDSRSWSFRGGYKSSSSDWKLCLSCSFYGRAPKFSYSRRWLYRRPTPCRLATPPAGWHGFGLWDQLNGDPS